MTPIPIALVGYPVSWEFLEQYRILNSLPEYDNESLVHNLETKINTPIKLVCVDIYDVEETISNDYLCCFADFSGRPFEPQDLLDIPAPLHPISFHNTFLWRANCDGCLHPGQMPFYQESQCQWVSQGE